FLFLFCTGLLILSAEWLLDIFLPEFHQVEQWLGSIAIGTAAVFMLTMVSCTLFLFRRKRRSQRDQL
ncbi:MAG: hypothetical protein KA408_16190, partial [Flavobacteriales bacterium]|nr:hypothetical protein [Flavobacteriales bacterium]